MILIILIITNDTADIDNNYNNGNDNDNNNANNNKSNTPNQTVSIQYLCGHINTTGISLKPEWWRS